MFMFLCYSYIIYTDSIYEYDMMLWVSSVLPPLVCVPQPCATPVVLCLQLKTGLFSLLLVFGQLAPL